MLELTILGAEKGESIVLRLPPLDGRERWGVVDCYCRSLSDPDANPTLRFLKDNGATELEFLCLTHPHEDHYRGMSQLLNAFPVRYFWRSQAMNVERLKWILSYDRQDAARRNDQNAEEDARELQAIFNEIELKKKANNGQSPLIPKNAGLGMILYPGPSEANAEIQVISLAPSGRQQERFELGLKTCFDAGRLKSDLPTSHHNIASMALLVKYGQTQIVLGGDVESSGWQNALEEVEANNLAAHAVKVSHHGSTNGYCGGLWGAFAATGRPIAIIAPYRRFKLPRQESLEHIRSHCKRLFVTCLKAVDPDISKMGDSLDPNQMKSRIILSAKMKAVPSEGPLPFGRWSFRFDNAGNLINSEFDGSAGEI